MSSPLATFYGSDRAASTIGTRSDLVFHASLTIDNTVNTPQTVPLSPIGAGIDLGRLPGSVAAYLSIKQAVVSTRKSPSFADKHRAACLESFAATAPGSANTAFNFTFNTSNNGIPTFFSHIFFTSATTSNFTISSMFVNEHSSGTQYPTGEQLVAPLSTNGPQVAITNLFDPIDGLINFSMTNPGFDLAFEINNTNVSPITVFVDCYGSIYSFDWTQLLVRYVDWLGQPYNIGIFDDRAFSQPFGLGQKIPFPITNENQSNFGSLQFTVLNSNTSFNSQYTYDVILNASLEYQLG